MERNQGNLSYFFNPKSVAIVGASAEEGKVGNVIAKNVLNLGYQGEVFLVNPKHKELLGKRCYSSVEEIGNKIDLVIVAIPSKFVNNVVEQSSKASKNFVIISSGFSETGEEGKKKESELKEIAQNKGLNILGPNCLGFIHPKLKLNASFAGGMPSEGNVAFVSQSGALAVAIMDIAKEEHIGFSKVVSIGNKMRIDEASLLKYLDKDSETKVIALYLEGINQGGDFLEIAQKISKPVVILKAGKTEKSQEVIASHTGALAGSEAVMNAIFAKAGIIQAETLEDFFNFLNICSKSDSPSNNQVAIVTNAGGPGVLTTDAFGNKGIQLVGMSQEEKDKLRQLLPKEASVENPIDLLGDAKDDRYEKILDIIASTSDVGSVLCILTPQDQTPAEKVADVIINFKRQSKKVIIAIFIGGEKVKQAIFKMKSAGVVIISFPEQAVRVLDAYYLWSKNKIKNKIVKAYLINKERQSRVVKIIARAKKDGRSALLFSEAAEIMKEYHIPVSDYWLASSLETITSEIVYPVAVKIDSADVLHKTEKKGVALWVANESELKKTISKMRADFLEGNIIVQPMAERGMELILGIKKDDLFGLVILYGLGGIYTEVFKTVEFLIPPESKDRIMEKLIDGKLGFLFKETRGQARYKLEELADILYNLQCLAQEIDSIKELDINPLFVYNNGKKFVAVDVKFIFN